MSDTPAPKDMPIGTYFTYGDELNRRTKDGFRLLFGTDWIFASNDTEFEHEMISIITEDEARRLFPMGFKE